MNYGSVLRNAVAAGFFAVAAMPVLAEENAVITLKSLDGTVVLTGKLQEYEAGYYYLMVTGVGLILVAEDLVTCQSSGIDCAALVERS
ncbi:MAG: hypothetical protein L3J37_12445 [Rhodobacteraceae bacterium]|nr:hypothetical protein [Paracoccaceae bacterium]